MMRQITIFDLDGTLLNKDSFVSWLKHLMIHRPAPPKKWPLIFIDALLFKLGVCSNHWTKARFIGHMAGGLNREQLYTLTEPWLEHLIAENVFSDAIKTLDDCRMRGDHLMMITASPDFYAEQIAERLGIDTCLATPLEWTPTGHLSGCLAGPNCYGPEKCRRLELWLGEQGMGEVHEGLANVEIHAYSDHHSDLPLLLRANKGYAVNPTQALMRLIKNNNLIHVIWG